MIRILSCREVARSEIFARSAPKTDVAGTVSEIIRNVRERGDAALFEYCERFDGAQLASLAAQRRTEKRAADHNKRVGKRRNNT